MFPVLMVLGLVSITAPATIPFPAACVVDGVVLMEWEAERELARRVTNSRFHRRIPPDRMKEFRQEALESLILKELKLQFAERQGFQLDQEKVEAERKKIRDRFDSESNYVAALKEQGITQEAFRRGFTRDAAADAVDRLIQERIEPPSAEDAVFHYLNHKSDYTMPESRHVIHSLIYVSPNANATERVKAEKRAAEFSAEARSGTALVDLLRKTSKGLPPKYSDQVGDLGFVHRGTMVGGLDDVVFSAPVGEIVGPEKSIYGFHILQVLEAREGRALSFEEVKDAVAASLRREGRAEGLRIFEAGLLGNAQIEIGEWVEQPE